MISLEEARERIFSELPILPSENTPLLAALGRILAADVFAETDLPPFDNSAMDGYAVQSADLLSAAPDAPVELKVLDEVAAGSVGRVAITSGGCARIFTGSPLPPGADAVVMQEETRIPGPNRVAVLDRVQPWENVRFRGEDVKKGSGVARRGEALTAARLSLCAALGMQALPVARLPVVGLLATGSELREAGQPLGPGQIYESNRVSIALLLSRLGIAARIYPLAADTLADTRAALEKGLAECDALITSGGVSVGKFDFVKEAFASLGGQTDFWRVAIKPGKPFLFGRKEGRLLFGLPGNPVSAFVTFLTLVRPALLKMQGAARVELPSWPGLLSEPLSNPGDRRHFIRARADEAGWIHPAGIQASHILSSLAESNGLLDLPAGATWEKGARVHLFRWE